MTQSDIKLLEAAEGWIGLGKWQEANEELECISPEMRSHPDVLDVRWQVYAFSEKWEMALEIASSLCAKTPDYPHGPVRLAFTLEHLNLTEEARDVLLVVVSKFPDTYPIHYSLARLFCKLGKLSEAKKWLKQAFKIADGTELQEIARQDGDLEPIWRKFGEI